MNKNIELTYPCPYPIKVIGWAKKSVFETVQKVVHEKQIVLETNGITEKLSKEGRYTSVTIHMVAENENQVSELHMELKQYEEILMIL